MNSANIQKNSDFAFQKNSDFAFQKNSDLRFICTECWLKCLLNVSELWLNRLLNLSEFQLNHMISSISELLLKFGQIQPYSEKFRFAFQKLCCTGIYISEYNY